MYKRFLIITITLLSAQVLFAQNRDEVTGKWLSSSKDGQIEIYKKGDKYFGKLIWLKEPNDENGHPKTDTKNPKENLRKTPVLGLEILKNFIYTGNKWEGGTIYDPKSGKTYSCKITLRDENHLNLRGFIGVSLIGRTEVWQRIK